jgi:hypothetical protein
MGPLLLLLGVWSGAEESSDVSLWLAGWLGRESIIAHHSRLLLLNQADNALQVETPNISQSPLSHAYCSHIAHVNQRRHSKQMTTSEHA